MKESFEKAIDVNNERRVNVDEQKDTKTFTICMKIIDSKTYLVKVH